jgi:transcriptional regulator GlxA family with amidase domain
MAELVELVRREAPAVPGLALAVVQTIAAQEQRARRDDALHPALAATLRRIDDDLLEPRPVVDLARAARLSPSHLTALFRARFGCGVAAYRQQRRLALAARLLADPYLAVAEVAAACGYADGNLFARRFRAHHGCSPSAWRARNR